MGEIQRRISHRTATSSGPTGRQAALHPKLWLKRSRHPECSMSLVGWFVPDLEKIQLQSGWLPWAWHDPVTINTSIPCLRCSSTLVFSTKLQNGPHLAQGEAFTLIWRNVEFGVYKKVGLPAYVTSRGHGKWRGIDGRGCPCVGIGCSVHLLDS